MPYVWRGFAEPHGSFRGASWMMRRSILLGVTVLLLGGLIRAEEWPGWRGPRGDGTSQEPNIPVRWSTTENVHWKAAIPGKGHSSPAIWGDRIFLTTCLEDSGKRVLLCID